MNKLGVKSGLIRPDELNFPPWDSVKQHRDNFVIISPEMTLEEAKEKMNSKNMTYGVISKNNCILGVLNYSLLSL